MVEFCFIFILMDSSMKKTNQDVHSYIVQNLNCFIEPLVTQLVKKRPADPINYAINWLTQHDRRKPYRSRRVIDSDTDEEGKDEVNELTQNLGGKKKSTRRVFISEEAFGEYNDRAELQLTQTEHLASSQKQMMRNFMKQSILFQNLDRKDEEIIMRAMTIRETQEYQVIIKEGEPGSHFYIVSQGEFDCYKLTQGQNVFVKTYQVGESFGELSLMYNAPRAATLISNLPGKLLSLDRSIFSHILKVAALRKQIIIKAAIDKVQLLKNISSDQKYTLINILQQEKHESNSYVIKEGQQGDKFYIVLEGKLTAQKTNDKGQISTVWQFSEGDYFGELALINNEPRQASVRVIKDAKLACVSREDFKRVFGQVYEQIKQKTARYHD